MNTMEWVVIAGLVLFLWLGLAAVNELKKLRATVAELLGSVAQALWRIRDELTEMNKRQKS